MTYAELEIRIEQMRRHLAQLIYQAKGCLLDPAVQEAGAQLNQLILQQMRLDPARPYGRQDDEP